jgi:uncharacterized protein YdhG (YjbR/CyaY superfamily)
MKPKETKPKDVDAYIASAPLAVQGKLRDLRRAIRTAAPGASEKISYGMPYYSHNGRIAYFRHWKDHIGLYIPTPVVEDHRSLLKAYEISSATIRFPLKRKLPLPLIRKLIKARVKRNET